MEADGGCQRTVGLGTRSAAFTRNPMTLAVPAIGIAQLPTCAVNAAAGRSGGHSSLGNAMVALLTACRKACRKGSRSSPELRCTRGPLRPAADHAGNDRSNRGWAIAVASASSPRG